MATATKGRRPATEQDSTATEPTNGAQAATAPERIAPIVVPDDVEALVYAKVAAAYEQRLGQAAPEQAEPEFWWDVASFGPIQIIQPGGPLLPHQIIKVGESAFVAAIVLLNPLLQLPGGTNAADVLSNFALPIEFQYQAGNLTTWSIGQADMQRTNVQTLVPGQFFYVDVIQFTGSTPGLYEMNIASRILGAAPPNINAPQFAAFATQVFSLDVNGLFGSLPQSSMRFQVYPA